MIAHFNRSSANIDALKAEKQGNIEAVQADLRDEKAAEQLFAGRPCQVLVGGWIRC